MRELFEFETINVSGANSSPRPPSAGRGCSPMPPSSTSRSKANNGYGNGADAGAPGGSARDPLKAADMGTRAGPNGDFRR